MSDFVGQTLEQMLGQDFLTWLWFRSETAETFKTGGEEFSVIMERRIVVQGGEGDLQETASVFGAASELREARLGLTTGKKVIRALLRLEKGEENWILALKAEDFGLGSFKTPKIADQEKDEDWEAAFFEKVYLLEKGLEFLDTLYKNFLELRLDRKWQGEAADIRQWITTYFETPKIQADREDAGA